LHRDRWRRIRILIENKLDAAFQPQPAERYRTRGDAYFQNGECDRWVNVLLAPRECNPFGFPSGGGCDRLPHRREHPPRAGTIKADIAP